MESRRKIALVPVLAAVAALCACTDSGQITSSSTTSTPAPSVQTTSVSPETAQPPVLDMPSAGSTSNGPATLEHGLALRDAGKLDEAEMALVRASEADPGSSRILVHLARVRMSRGEGASTLEAAERALSITPNSASALHQKGRALAALNRGVEAIEVLRTAREMAPDNGYIANTLGWLLLTRGDAMGAVPHLEVARDLLPEVGYVRNNLGVAYERSGRTDEAIVEYRAAVAAGDSGGKALKSLERLHADPNPIDLGADQAPAEPMVADR